MVGRQLPFLTIIVLFWIMAIMWTAGGVKETRPGGDGRWRLVCYRPVSSAQLYRAGTAGHISSLVSCAWTLFLKRWQPVRIFRFGDSVAGRSDAARTHTTGQIVRAGRRSRS